MAVGLLQGGPDYVSLIGNKDDWCARCFCLALAIEIQNKMAALHSRRLYASCMFFSRAYQARPRVWL